MCIRDRLICFLTFGQEKNITGTVTDKNGPLPGASIVIKGTTNGVASDTYGKYAIKAKSGDILVFSYIGYPVSYTHLDVYKRQDQ